MCWPDLQNMVSNAGSPKISTKPVNTNYTLMLLDELVTIWGVKEKRDIICFKMIVGPIL